MTQLLLALHDATALQAQRRAASTPAVSFNLLALRWRGRHGLLFIDGHAGFYRPDAAPDGRLRHSKV
jgi:hypothetical protein